MTSLKEVRSRIASIQSTRKVTSAMKMVAASRLRSVQNHILYLRQYEKVLRTILDDMMLVMPAETYNFFMKSRQSREVLIVCMGSNRGLCGAYNALVIKRTLQEIEKYENDGFRVKLMVVGKKLQNFFKKRDYTIMASDVESIDRLSQEKAAGFASKIKDLYLKEHTASVVVIYHRFRNAAVHDVFAEKVLPVSLGNISEVKARSVSESSQHERLILEPSSEQVLDHMVSQYLHYQCFRLLLDAAASEHGSRMTAMHKATDNADDLLKDLSLAYNKARQSNITRELLDIMGGAEKGIM